MCGAEGLWVWGLGHRIFAVESPVLDRICGIWGSYYNIHKAIFYLIKGDNSGFGTYEPRVWGPGVRRVAHCSVGFRRPGGA